MDEYEDYEVLQDDSYEEEYGTHYGKYAGTYAHDVAGFSDEDIDTILMANRKPIGI